MSDFYVYVLQESTWQDIEGHPIVFVNEESAYKYCKTVYNIDAIEYDANTMHKQKNTWYVTQTCLYK